MSSLPSHCWLLITTARSLFQEGYPEAAEELLRRLSECRSERMCPRITRCRAEYFDKPS